MKILRNIQDREVQDYNSITWSSSNYIEFGNDKIYFPFDSYEVGQTLCALREKLLDKNIRVTDLQSYPIQIFKGTELKHYPDLAGWIYNIIETWVTDVEVTIHENKKNRLFDSFLKTCETYALEAKPLASEQPEKTEPTTGQHNINTLAGTKENELKQQQNNEQLLTKKIRELVTEEIAALSPKQQENKTEPQRRSGPTHREAIFAHQYKIKTGEAQTKTATEWQNERKGRAKIEFYTTVNSKNSKSFRPESIKELTTILQLLEGFEAQKIAKNKLDQLQNQ